MKEGISLDSIPKFLVSIITMAIGIVLCMSFLISSIVVNSAKVYHSSVVEHIEASYFDEATIEKCELAAEKANYNLTIEKNSAGEGEPYTFYKVTLKYNLAAPIFGKVHSGTLVGYALSSTHNVSPPA